MNNVEKLVDHYFSHEFESVNRELRQHFQLANKEIEQVKGHVNELVVIVHDDNPKWSMKKICDYIAGRNDDLEEFGFSSSTIMRYLNEENRKLIDATKSHKGKSGRKPKFVPSQELEDFREQKGTMSQNNVMEQSDFNLRNQKVLEESSITSGSNEPTIEDEEVIYDDPVKQLEESQKAYEELLRKYEELEQKYEQVIIPFEAKGSVIAPNGQEIPIIGKVDPFKKTISFEIDQKEVKKLKRF